MERPRVGPPDAALIDRVRRGDPKAFDQLVRRHYRAAYGVALAQLGSPMDAEDVCQDAFIRALERIEDCRKPDRFAAWFLQIVRNRAHNFRDYRRVRAAEDVDTVPAADRHDSARDAERAELGRRLNQAMGALSPIQREVVLLHDLEGWKHREIGRHMKISEGMCRQHLFAARRILRERLGPEAVKEYFRD